MKEAAGDPGRPSRSLFGESLERFRNSSLLARNLRKYCHNVFFPRHNGSSFYLFFKLNTLKRIQAEHFEKIDCELEMRKLYG